MNDASMKRKEDEIEAKSRALQQKETTMSEFTQQLSKVREYLSDKQQVLQDSITWKQCFELPTKLHFGKTTVNNSRIYIYCGGGFTHDEDVYDKYIVCCYDPSQDNWTTLSLLSVRYFGLSQINGMLVAVGGKKKSDNNPTNELFTYDTQSSWKTLPNTPTYRPDADVLAGNLLTIGGRETSKGRAAKKEVYIYSPSTESWIYISDLPKPRSDTAVAVLSSTEILVIGGWYDGEVNTVYIQETLAFNN